MDAIRKGVYDLFKPSAQTSAAVRRGLGIINCKTLLRATGELLKKVHGHDGLLRGSPCHAQPAGGRLRTSTCATRRVIRRSLARSDSTAHRAHDSAAEKFDEV